MVLNNAYLVDEPLHEYRHLEISHVLIGVIGQIDCFDEYLIELWSWPGDITINVDGLERENHTFKLYIRIALLERNTDTVVVHVVETLEEIPSGVFTNNIGSIMETDEAPMDLSVLVFLVSMFFVAVIIIWKTRKT